jgi:hypothetical protein
MQAGVSALPLTTLLAGLVLAQFDARMPFAIVGVKRGIRAEIDDVWWLLPHAIVIETFQSYCPGRCPVFLPAPHVVIASSSWLDAQVLQAAGVAGDGLLASLAAVAKPLTGKKVRAAPTSDEAIISERIRPSLL